MGFGRDPASFDPRGVELHGGAAFAGSLGVVADALSLPLDDVVASGEVAVARQATEVAAGRIEAGTIGAQRMQVTGMRNGQPLLTFSANWYLTDGRGAGLGISARRDGTSWSMATPPSTSTSASRCRPRSGRRRRPGLTAHRPVNAVPYVCAAEPGIRTSVDLPQIIPTLG